MIEQINAHLTWQRIKQVDGLSKEDTFELLCADYIKEEHKLSISLPLGKSNYPGTEGNCVKGEKGWYGFQAKFGQEPFSKTEIIDSISKINNKTDILFICTKEEYPSSNRKKGKEFDLSNIGKNKDDWDDYTKDLIDTGTFKEVHFLCGNEFLNNIKRYPKIVNKFFPVKEVLIEIYGNHDQVDIKDKRILDKILDVKKGFEGEQALYKGDIEIAEYYQKQYLIRKLGYANTSFVLDKYSEMEEDIASEMFEILQILSYDDLKDFLQQAVFELKDKKELHNKYEIELDNMISTEQGLFVNYGTEGKSALKYESGKKVKFIVK